MSSQKLVWGNPKQGINPLAFAGGIRYGENYWNAFNATSPFAKLTITPESIALSTFWKTFAFSKIEIKRVTKYSGGFSAGIRIEHDLTQYPPFIVFWTRNLDKVVVGLAANGFALNEPVSN